MMLPFIYYDLLFRRVTRRTLFLAKLHAAMTASSDLAAAALAGHLPGRAQEAAAFARRELLDSLEVQQHGNPNARAPLSAEDRAMVARFVAAFGGDDRAND